MIDLIKEEEIIEWWERNHLSDNRKWLTGSSLTQYLDFFEVHAEYRKAHKVLEVGIGLTNAITSMFKDGKEVYATDISEAALNKVSSFVHTFQLSELNKLPLNSIDIVFSFLVAQHINDEMLIYHLTHILPALKKDGIFCLHYAGELNGNSNGQGQVAQQKGGIVRTSTDMKNLVRSAKGMIVGDCSRVKGADAEGHEWEWRSAIITRGSG